MLNTAETEILNEDNGIWLSINECKKITQIPEFMIKEWAKRGVIESKDANYAYCKVELGSVHDAINRAVRLNPYYIDHKQTHSVG